MFISRLFIKNFRNLRHLDVEIERGVTCFIGENNSGKTNVLQAIRFVLDGNISAQRRRLQAEDLSAGLQFTAPEHVLISVEFSDFAGRPNEEALPFTAILRDGKARISYRFRPKATVREAIEQLPQGDPAPQLGMDDYVWEMAAGGDDINLDTVTWKDSFGTRFSTDNLQQGYLVVLMEALRDVESRLGAPRTSPLQQIVEQRKSPEAEQAALVGYLQTANTNINASATIGEIGAQLSNSFEAAAGKSFAMGVSPGWQNRRLQIFREGSKFCFPAMASQTLTRAEMAWALITSSISACCSTTLSGVSPRERLQARYFLLKSLKPIFIPSFSAYF